MNTCRTREKSSLLIVSKCLPSPYLTSEIDQYQLYQERNIWRTKNGRNHKSYRSQLSDLSVQQPTARTWQLATDAQIAISSRPPFFSRPILAINLIATDTTDNTVKQTVVIATTGPEVILKDTACRSRIGGRLPSIWNLEYVILRLKRCEVARYFSKHWKLWFPRWKRWCIWLLLSTSRYPLNFKCQVLDCCRCFSIGVLEHVK